MTVQVDLGTQATDSSLIEEHEVLAPDSPGGKASALTHRTIQRSFSFAVLVCILWTCKTSFRYRWLESDHLPLSSSAYSSWKYFSSALRTFDRARWRRTR